MPSIAHRFVSAVPDGPDATIVQPSNWNETHTLTVPAGKLIGNSGGLPGVEDVIVGSGLAFSSATLSADVISVAGRTGNVALAVADISGALSAATATATYQPIGSYLTTVSLTANVTGILPVANGGTGTATPGLVAGSNVSITGAWPNQTVAAAVPAASSTTPLVDGTAAVGVGNTFARADHVHPTDTSRASVNAPAFTGSVTLPSWTTAGRPSPGVVGMIGWNTDLARFDHCVGAGTPGTWKNFVRLDGDTMTGLLVLSADPSAALGAATKQYVDLRAPIASPTFTGTVTVPNGAALGTPASINLTSATALPLSSGVTGTLPVANGGTGQATAATGADALLGGLSTTQGAIAYRGASAWVALAPGTAGQVLASGGAAANPGWTSAGAGMSLLAVNTYNPGDTAAAINASAKLIIVECIGGGGGGGGGVRQGTASTASSAGAGGGGGGRRVAVFSGADVIAAFGSSATVSVGSGGAAGTGGVASGTGGGNGGATVFGGSTTTNSWLQAYAGGGGIPGNTGAAVTQGGGGAGLSGNASGVTAGTSGGASGASGAVGSLPSTDGPGSSGGGALANGGPSNGGAGFFGAPSGATGGGITAVNAANNGGIGGAALMSGTAGGAFGANSTSGNGGAGTGGTTGTVGPGSGGGGGGSTSFATGTGGAGGAGGIGAGGGGGGGSISTSSAGGGNGGAGGNGRLRVWQYG